MGRQILRRLLRPFCRAEEKEVVSLLLMFLYSFLADERVQHYSTDPALPLHLEGLGLRGRIQRPSFGLLMSGYAWLMSRLPRRWALPITQSWIILLLVALVLFSTLPEQKWGRGRFLHPGPDPVQPPSVNSGRWQMWSQPTPGPSACSGLSAADPRWAVCWAPDYSFSQKSRNRQPAADQRRPDVGVHGGRHRHRSSGARGRGRLVVRRAEERGRARRAIPVVAEFKAPG